MNVKENSRGQLVFSGTKQELDMAATWARAKLCAAFGPEEGEKRYKEIPLLVVLTAWQHAIDNAPEC